ncbi:MAG TPA: SMI1/KNR4 family protein [Tepidisphaeraceae bacterium]|jgi:hypothetical protein|nr:SMI1/KNR4 family protein [Tepidisphaeraceae bacterium]
MNRSNPRIPFADTLQQLVSMVFGTLLPEHGIDDTAISMAEKRLGIQFPRTLRSFYSLCGNHREVMDGMNHLLPLPELDIENGGLVFGEENQCVMIYGILLKNMTESDPPVMQRDPGEEPWYLDSEALSRFLLVSSCWQACNTLHSVAETTISPAQLQSLQSQYAHAIAGTPPDDPEYGFWRNNFAAVAFPKSGEMYIATTSDEELDRFGRLHGLDLSYC